MLSTGLSTGMALVSLALCVVCFIGTYSCVQVATRLAKDRRSYRALVLHLAELEDNHEALAASHKRLRSRVGMKELRARRKEAQNGHDDDPEPGPSISAENEREAWKRQKRIELATGKLKP